MWVRWDWDSLSGEKWRVVSRESLGTPGAYNLVYASCGKIGGRGCEAASKMDEKIPEVEGAKLFVHNVSSEVSGSQLREAFGQFGSVTHTYNPGRGFVFVTFSTAAEAQAALTATNGAKLFGYKINVKIAKPRQSMSNSTLASISEEVFSN